MKNKSAKEKMIYFYHAEMCKVFSHPTRLEIINTLRDKEVTVGELAKKLKLGIGNLSQHLSMMKDRRILSSRKEGNQVYYRIANPKMLEAFDLLREILLEQIQKDSLLLTEETKTKKRHHPIS
ncbi:MAG: metalloregulator ArsR/SmtB family transcription factor [candidate division Zixibacteria bacterium]|nr:metalloregulator ArsR/SmtB family transcription factor [candidate division Zixibacteria bacterium]